MLKWRNYYYNVNIQKRSIRYIKLFKYCTGTVSKGESGSMAKYITFSDAQNTS